MSISLFYFLLAGYCPLGWKIHGLNVLCWKVVEEPMTWYEANENCARMAPGAEIGLNEFEKPFPTAL